jgi:hypothetical protein
MNFRVQSFHKMDYDLNDYIGFHASNDIIHNLRQMELKEILELKESLETILKFLSVGKIYH